MDIEFRRSGFPDRGSGNKEPLWHYGGVDTNRLEGVAK